MVDRRSGPLRELTKSVVALGIEMERNRVAVLGCGPWGRNHVRNFASIDALGAVCDTSDAGRALARQLAPDVSVLDDHRRALDDPVIGGVVVATPAVTHAAICRDALEAGKDVLCEKPLALSLDVATELASLAREHGRILMVGHVLEYHPAIRALREVLARGRLGELRSILSTRLSAGRIRVDEDVLWSLAPHDAAVILRLVGEEPESVVATGSAHVTEGIADLCWVDLGFPNGVAGQILVSWIHPFKEQRLVVVGTERMASYDDVAKELRLWDHRVETGPGGAPTLVQGASELVPFAGDEPLALECRAFLDAIATRETPLTDADSALAVLRVLEAARESMSRRSRHEAV